MSYVFSPPPVLTTRPTLQGTVGMVASTHWIATATAQGVLEGGGNAYDAAAAAGFVLHVVEPHLNGPGGDMVAIFATAQDPGNPVVLMGQGPAPARATREHFISEGLNLVPGAGALAAAVPGAVDAWLTLLRDHGTWELADILAPAIGYARDGQPVLAATCRTIAQVEHLFRQHWPTSADIWLPGGAPPRPGELVRNPAYGQTLERLVAAGRSLPAGADRVDRIESARLEWREGFVAEAAARFAASPHRHSDGADHTGVITRADFAAFTARYEPALTAEFRGHTVAKAGPWSQGPALLQMLTILDGLDDSRLDPSTADGAHTILEVLKLALADRDGYYGDDDTMATVLEVILSPTYAAQRRELIGETASSEIRPGEVPGVLPFSPPLRVSYTPSTVAGEMDRSNSSGAVAAVGEPTVSPTGESRGDTSHIDIVDRWGNMISATPSGGWLQSSPTVPELGFALGTRLQMMWLEEGSAATLQPGRRPRTTLTPTLVLRNGHPVTALGSPGGDQQDQWQLLYLLRTIVGGYTPQEAIDAATFHTRSMPDSFWPRTWDPGRAVVEDRLGEDVIADLEDRGHRVTRAGDWALGRLSAVTRDPATGVLGAAANPRGMQGYAGGR